MAASRPAFIFSYNAQDEDVAALVSSSTSTPSTSRHAYAGLGIADSHARARQDYARHSRDNDEDDWVPTYGPTTHRKGKMRFVPARDPHFQTLPGRQEEVTVDDAEQPQTRAAPAESAEPKQRAPAGTDIRNLYASIVGLDKSPNAAPGITQSEPASRRTSLPPPASATNSATETSAPSAEEARSSSRKKRPRTASPPPVPFEPARGRAVPVFPVREPDIVLSSDSEDEPDDSGAQGGGSSTKNSRRGRPGSGDDDDGSADEDVDDDVVVIDPLTGLAEERRDPLANTTLRKRVQPLFIHQLLPRASSSADSDAAAGGPLKPFVPPTQYAIKPDSPGWRLLARQGWREGLPLGPVPAVVTAASSTSSDTLDGTSLGDAAAATTAGRLKVPLRAVEKHDRSGIGVAKAPQDRVVVGALNSEHARRAREERERERKRAEQELARARRGKGERGMERQRKKEERERKAWIAYMNR